MRSDTGFASRSEYPSLVSVAMQQLQDTQEDSSPTRASRAVSAGCAGWTKERAGYSHRKPANRGYGPACEIVSGQLTTGSVSARSLMRPEDVKRICKQVSVSSPYRGDSHEDRDDDYTLNYWINCLLSMRSLKTSQVQTGFSSKKALIGRALGAELSDHLGYEKGDPVP
ncbi:hypothetical protein GWE18_40470 [Bradyrhizobium sp. CSA112]|nr:hypothetical protein [Bradyrhizobium sp. CSA112]